MKILKFEINNNNIKILKNIGWLLIDKIIRFSVGLAVNIWVARYLGPLQFGVFSFAQAFVSIFNSLSGLGLQGVVVRDILKYPDFKEEIIGAAAVLQCVGGVAAFCLLMMTISLLRPDDVLVKSSASILGLMILFKAHEVSVYWFESQVMSKYIVVIQNAILLTFSFIKIYLILIKAKFMAFVWVTSIESVMIALFAMVLFGFYGISLAKLRVSMRRIKELIQDSLPLMFSSLVVMIYLRIDQIMIGEFLGEAVVGVYSVAVRISESWFFFPIIISASFFPTILACKKNNDKLFFKKMQFLFDIMFIVSFIVALFVSIMSERIISMLFGNAYLGASGVLSIHIWTAVFVFLGVVGDRWCLVENRQVLTFHKNILGMLANVILNIILVPRYGAVGAAWGTLIAQFASNVLFDIWHKETRIIFVMKLKSINVIRLYKSLM